MKRVLTFLAIMLLPLSVMAMTPVSDQTLSDVTGQAGVNINADLMMDIYIGTLAWGDADGITASGSHPAWGTTDGGGYVGVTGLNITDLRIKARETDTFNGYLAPDMLKPITIDVATDADMYDGATFVRFGLGSLEISMDALTLSVELGPDTALGQKLGVVSLGAMALYINPISYVDIFAADGCGVNINMNVVLDKFDIDYVSWGDTDGQDNPSQVPAAPWMGDTAAGYVGLYNLEIGGPIMLTGQVAIDVNTTNVGIYSHGGTLTPTVVHISFPEVFTVDVTGPITADVRLDGQSDLAGVNFGVLGDIYISAFKLDIGAGSWVDIWAH